MLRPDASLVDQTVERPAALDDDLLPETPEMHSIPQLLHGDPVVEEGSGEAVVGVVGTVSADDVVSRQIHAEVLLEPRFRLRREACIRADRPVPDQDREPAEDAATVQIEDLEIVRISGIFIRVSAAILAGGPFLGHIQGFGAVESENEVVVPVVVSEERPLELALGTVVEREDAHTDNLQLSGRMGR